jgi:hypothetical protein
MHQTQCVINYPTHSSHVTIEPDGLIRVFKYNNGQCDFGVFTKDQQELASEYMLAELPGIEYKVTASDGTQLL